MTLLDQIKKWWHEDDGNDPHGRMQALLSREELRLLLNVVTIAEQRCREAHPSWAPELRAALAPLLKEWHDAQV